MFSPPAVSLDTGVAVADPYAVGGHGETAGSCPCSRIPNKGLLLPNKCATQSVIDHFAPPGVEASGCFPHRSDPQLPVRVLPLRSTNLPGSLSAAALFCHDTLSRRMGPQRHKGSPPPSPTPPSLSAFHFRCAEELLIGSSGRATSQAMLLLIIGGDMHKSLCSLAALAPAPPPSTLGAFIPPSSLSGRRRCSSVPALITFGRRVK